MFRFTCTPDGGEPFEVVAKGRAIAAWENAPGQPRGTRRSVGDLTQNFRMADMIDVAWFAASRAHQTDLDLPAWREEVEVELEKYEQEDDGEAGPTGPTP